MINSFRDVLKRQDSIACLDSGGLDSAYLICRLTEMKITEIHVLTLDLGQEDCKVIHFPPFIEDKLIRHRLDVRDIFCESYVLPLLQAHGLYSNQHPLSASLSRPLIALSLVNIANEKNITSILHAATPSQNSMRRFNGAIKDLKFKGEYGSPYANDHITREDKATFIRSLGCNIPVQRFFSIDSNLFCREFESGSLNNPETIRPPEEMFIWSKESSVKTRELTIHFEQGRPVGIDDDRYQLASTISFLNKLIGSYGLGRYRGLEENPFGEKVLEVREAPAAYILLQAYQYLMNASFSHNTLVTKSQLDQLWTREASEGRWFGPLKSAIDSFNSSLCRSLSGSVSFSLSPRSCECIGIKSASPLYTLDREANELKHLNLIKVAV
tara:strand:- start:48514 stop:49665 length:1152 start_codon:yes stop_codon:yes gene_type:complete